MTLHIWHLDRYAALTSELTGRTVYANESPDSYLISPNWTQKSVREAVAEWAVCIQELRASHRPPAQQRAAVMELSACDTPEAFGASLDAVLLREFKSKLDNPVYKASQRFLSALMLSFWSRGLVAWPAASQEPFPSAVLSLDNFGWGDTQKRFLTKVRGYLDRGAIDDSVNFRFFVDMLLSRAGIIELGDVTPETMQYEPGQTRQGKPRAMAFSGVLQALRESYSVKQVPWTLESFGFYRAKSGHLHRDDDFRWALAKDPALEAWVNLAKQHLADNSPNFKKRRSSVNVFIKYLAENPTLPRSPAGYFDVRRRPEPQFQVEGNKGRQTMTVVHQFLQEVLLKVCTQADDHELPILMPGFANPVVLPTYRGVNKGETHREPMPNRLIQQAMNVLTENDFAWVREVGRHKDTFRWVNPETGKFETIWSPVPSGPTPCSPSSSCQPAPIRFATSTAERATHCGTAWVRNGNSTRVHAPPRRMASSAVSSGNSSARTAA